VQRIEVTDDGITITTVTEPARSVFGKPMSRGSTSVDELTWDLIHRVHIDVLDGLPPDGDRWITLVVDLTFGEFVEVPETADGFTEAIEALCRRSGLPVPPAHTPADIWPALRAHPVQQPGQSG
jgi:hypothetical protein